VTFKLEFVAAKLRKLLLLKQVWMLNALNVTPDQF
jgi:hypothetical protein